MVQSLVAIPTKEDELYLAECHRQNQTVDHSLYDPIGHRHAVPQHRHVGA